MDESHDYGERGRPAGLPDCNYDDGIDHFSAILKALTGPMPSAREQARRWTREAMEELCGEGHVALALTPPECRMQPLSERELDELAIRQGDAGEARLHFFGRRPVNYHE